jgi:hypothetical protein
MDVDSESGNKPGKADSYLISWTFHFCRQMEQSSKMTFQRHDKQSSIFRDNEIQCISLCCCIFNLCSPPSYLLSELQLLYSQHRKSVTKAWKTVFQKVKKICVTHCRPHPLECNVLIEWPLKPWKYSLKARKFQIECFEESHWLI